MITVKYQGCVKLLIEQKSTIQLFAAATCPLLDMLLQQIAESYLLAQ